ncbi:Condensation domain-containing protein [Pseudobutyrivibrio sp. OR37]|uniref:condensation domain-containing protein n=1 Tax=Pseudobutyrivibrio sp. OR37 TaxID=1798186 RepID=UPI0008ECC407|nr:condensation domain-containing protein [Pseudobutyrivibrio sp. OR37]SFI12148.1 Condensation domain-containing protein [Pseudobutyrivibrio sp. OR37]
MKKYPLTPAQKMHYNWIRKYGTQQVSGLSIVASLQANLDFDLLKKCIQLEIKRYGCMRVRFTKPDKNGDILQYLSEDENYDIPLKDLSDMTMDKADETMQSWAYNTFDGDDIPMFEIFLMKLPDGYNGFFLHMDHRLIDSCGVTVLTNDIMSLYTHFRFDAPLPADLADYETVLQNDLKKASNEKRFLKDKKFWDDLIDKWGEPIYSDIAGPATLAASRRAHNNPALNCADIELRNLFVEVKDYKLEADGAKQLFDFCQNHQLSMTNLLLLGIRTYLSKVNNGQKDISIQNFISRRSTHDEWTSGGSRTIMFPCRTVIEDDTDFLEAAYQIQNMQNQIYMHSNYDPDLIYEEIEKRYGTPKNTTYESCYLTYQPLPVKMENPYLTDIPMYCKWFANGAATKKMYLTVSHTEDGGMNFSYHYQVADLTEKQVELFNYYLMRIIFRGVEQPNLTIGEIINIV